MGRELVELLGGLLLGFVVDGEEMGKVEKWLNMRGDFTDWIDRLIVAQGAKYWRWY